LLVVVLIIVAVTAILFPAIQAAQTAASRTVRMNNLKNTSLAVQNFHDTYRQFPLAIRRDEVGRPLSSWRYQILPFVAAYMVDVDYSKPWCDPDSQYFLMRPVCDYCFSEARGELPYNTNVSAIVGPGTVFGDVRANTWAEVDSKTILVIEVTDFDRHWMEPGDLHIDHLPDSIMNGIDGQGLCVAFLDGSGAYVSKTTPLDELRKYMTAGDVERRDPNLFHH